MLRIIGFATVFGSLAFGALYYTGNLNGSAEVKITEQGKKNLSRATDKAEEGFNWTLQKAEERISSLREK